MSLKKLFLILFLLSASIAYPADNKQPPVTSEQNQETPLPPPEQMPAPLPSSTEMTNSYEGAFVRMLVTLLGLVALVFATFWILKRLGKGQFKMGTKGIINVIEKRALSPKSMLYIVSIGNKKVLISESQVEVRALSVYEEIPEVNE
jgi:flagellar biogenesis protein FliO